MPGETGTRWGLVEVGQIRVEVGLDGSRGETRQGARVGRARWGTKAAGISQ